MMMTSLFDSMMNTIWDDMDLMSRFSDIPTNVKEDENGYTVEMAVPGLERRNFSLKVCDGVLRLRVHKGHRFHWPWQKNHTYIRGERQLPLPSFVDVKGIKARVNNGVLSIRMPKKESYIQTTVNKGDNTCKPVEILVA